MEVILTLLLCALGLFLYLLNSNKNEVLRLRLELRDKEIELSNLRYELRDKDRVIEELRRQLAEKSSPSQELLPPPSGTFVRVIFNEGDTKYYHYLLGDNDVQVGDFVEVYATDKSDGKLKCKVAQVVYISKPGEVSKFAKTEIIKKADRPKW
ncbi:MAG: hypothetical protein IJ774_07480 [Selenomonadaceae bacterium]|nr:hypothetical protein [Selenomonadaceae bacterium]